MDVMQYIENQDYKYIGNLFDDIFIREDLIESKYHIDFITASELFPKFSSKIDQDRDELFSKFADQNNVCDNNNVFDF